MIEKERIDRELAVTLFNKTWEFFAKERLSEREKIEMIETAHASLYHWLQVGNATNFLIGHWQISRAYSLLDMGESALFHAQQSLRICLEEKIRGFNLGYAYEALCRSFYVLKNHDEAAKYLALSKEQLAFVTEEEDKKYLMDDIQSLQQLLGS